MNSQQVNNNYQYTTTENYSNNVKFKVYDVKLATFNVDTNLYLETTLNNIFPEYIVANRMHGVLTKLNKFKEQNVDIICIQEGRKCQEKGISVNSVDPIIEHLVANNYACENIHYNNSGDKAFQYITALNTDKFDILESKRTLLSIDGKEYGAIKTNDEISQLMEEEKKTYYKELKQHYFDQAHPRSIFITEAIHKPTSQQVFIANLHLGVFPESHKSKSINFVIQQLHELQQQNPESIILLAGDFNSFADQQGTQQIKMLTDAGFTELSEKIKHPNGDYFPYNSTFIAFPYDYAAYNFNSDIKEKLDAIKNDIKNTTENPSETKLESIKNDMISIFDDCCSLAKNDKSTAVYPVTGQLDHVFVTTKNTNVVTTNESVVQIYDMAGNIIENSRNAVVGHIKTSLANKQPSFASDHQGIISKISITAKK